MSALPSGTVTFLFTDIEGSTKLARANPEAWEIARRRHNAILRGAIESNSGFVFQIIGDAFCAAFHKAGDALGATLTGQRNLQSEPWGDAVIRVRMGIHTGEAETDGKDYRGYITLSLVQRVMSAGHGGQILLSGVTEHLLSDQLPKDVTLRDLGEHKLKDAPLPVRIFQVVAPDLQRDFPPLRSLNETLNNLPVQLTSFVGRENEIAELKHELDEHRLVTLTGSGGTGKTRLSLQVAADLLDSFPNGVWFVELAPLADPDLIPQTILAAMGVHEQQGRIPLELLKEYLREKKSLIVLDNCEHLIEASAQVTNTLLSAAPSLKILASSREALGVKGELSYPVPSLSLPDPKHLPAVEQLSQYESVRLFIDRALLVNQHFVADKDNALFIARICYRLDGIPLAIELAAARIKMMSVEQISARLDDRFRLLTGGARTALPRQQTLRALIDWSYDLLFEDERLLLRRLSVFAGGWTLEAAEIVCIGQDDISSNDVLDLLTQLVNKSLVILAEHSQSGEARYRMLETIRQYAREKLLDARGSDIIRQQHLAYFVKLAEQAEPELYRSNQVLWLNRLDDELDNLRMALEWALTGDFGAGLRLMVSLRLFWDARGNPREMGDWLAQLLESYNTNDSLRAHALAIFCWCIMLLGDIPKARKIADESLRLARTLPDKQSEAFSLLSMGIVIGELGNVVAGFPYVEQSLALYRALGDKLGQATATSWLGLNNNDLDRSIAFAKEGLSLQRELGNLHGIADCLFALAQRAYWRGDFSSSVQLLEEALMIYRQLRNQSGEAALLQFHGVLAYWQGDDKQACAYYEESIVLGEKVGNHIVVLWAQVEMAYAVLRQGDIQQAREKFENSIRNMQKADLMIGVVYSIEGLAGLLANQGQANRATRLFAWTDAVREKLGDHRPQFEQASVERDLTAIHSKVDDAEFVCLSAEGRIMSMEQAIALAVED